MSSASRQPGCLSFVSFGVGIKVEANRSAHLDWIESRLEALLAGHVEAIGGRPVDHSFSVLTNGDGLTCLFLDGTDLGNTRSEAVALQYLAARLKLAVSESTRSHVIVHAGVVGVGTRAIILPGHSFQGKTTLVRALVARGAVYYSDDLAILDPQGLVHPFPKTLSLRGISNEYEQVERTVESLGGVTGTRPLPVGMVLFTRFSPESAWQPLEVSAGQALLKLAEHTQNVRTHPRAAMAVLSRVVNSGAVLWESARPDAGSVADQILECVRRVEISPSPC